MFSMAAWSSKPLDDREYPDEADTAEEPEDQVVLPCPECGAAVYEEAPLCPHCGFALPDNLRTWKTPARWYFRAGRYLAKTLAVNWLAWVAIGALTLAVTLVALLRK